MWTERRHHLPAWTNKRGQAFRCGLFATLAALALPTHAQMPVTDVANTAQNAEQLVRTTAQLAELVEQGEALLRQIELMEAEIAALTTPSSYGSVANSETYRRLRRLGNLEGVLGGDENAGPIGRLGREHLEAYGLVAGPDIFAGGADTPLAHAHDRSRHAVAAGAGTTRAVLAGTERRIDTLEALITAIDATPSAKASADLTARIAAENGLMLNEVLRLLAVNLELQQTALARELASDQAEADFFLSADDADGDTR